MQVRSVKEIPPREKTTDWRPTVAAVKKSLSRGPIAEVLCESLREQKNATTAMKYNFDSVDYEVATRIIGDGKEQTYAVYVKPRKR